MNMRTNVFKTLVFGLVLFVLACGTAPADPLLDMLPGDALFCVRINDLSGSLAKLDQYLIGVSPMGTAMLVNMQLAGIVGDPMLNGINMNGTFAVIGLPDMSNGLLVPVSDYSAFVQNNPNCTETDEGFAVLTPPDDQMGSYALMQAGGGKYALVVPEIQKNQLTGLKAALSGSSGLSARLNEDQAQEAVSASAWAFVNLSALYTQFSPLVTMQLQQTQQEMSTAMGDTAMGEFGNVYLQIYQELFELFGGQTDSATLAIRPEASNLMVDVSLRAKDGSDLAEMMVASPSAGEGFKYTGYLDSSYAVNGLMKWDSQSMLKLYDSIFKVLDAAKPDAAMNENITKMKEMTQKWLPTMGDEIAFSFSYGKGNPPFMLREIFGIKDREGMQAMMQESMSMVDLSVVGKINGTLALLDPYLPYISISSCFVRRFE